MTVPDESRDELLAPMLIAYDEALLRSAASPEAESIVEDELLAAELRKARRCLELLDRVRRLDAEEPAISDENAPPSAANATTQNDSTAALSQRNQAVRRQVPRQIGRFLIQRELGRGGLGLVLLAHDPELGRDVAVKIPRSDLLSTDEIEWRFLREAEAAARLSHPHLVALHEIGRDGPLVYLVSEYCNGPTLAQWLRSHPGGVPARQAALLVGKLAEAVQYAHSRGVLHRDIKPSNILLVAPEPSPRSGADQGAAAAEWPDDILTPKLTDFGMARLLESASDHTRTGAVLGTPAYMAPEQADGASRRVDIRADVYALGAVLYELLVGRPPYRGASDIDTLRQLLVGEPVAPRAANAAVPRDLEAICLKCLARSKEARYATARDLSDDLENYLQGKPTQARPLTAADQLWKWVRRRPAIAALLTVACGSLMTLFAIVLVYNTRLQNEVVRADEARSRAEQEAEASRQLLYAADVARAYEAFQVHHVPRTLGFLDAHLPKPGQRDLRDFAWHYVRGLCEQHSLKLQGHTDEVFSVCWSPDGKRLATASKDRTVRLWDATTGRSLQVLRGHTDEVTRVAYAPDGRLLASSSEDRTIRLWDPDDGQALGELAAHTDDVLAIAFSPDGKWLASGGRDNLVRLWSVETRIVAQTSQELHDAATDLAFSPDGGLLWATDEAGDLSGWDTRDWTQWRGGYKRGEQLLTLTYAHDQILAAGGSDHINCWSYEEPKVTNHRGVDHGHVDKVQCLAASRDGNQLASASKDGTIRLWSYGKGDSTPAPVRTIAGHTGRVWSVQFSPDGRYLASAGADTEVRLWNLDTPDGQPPFPETDWTNYSVGFSPDGKWLFTAGDAGYATAWDFDSRTIRATRKANRYRITAVKVSPDGKHVAVASEQSGELEILNAATFEVEREFDWPTENLSALAWSPDGKQLALGRGIPERVGAGIRVIEVATGRTLFNRSLQYPVTSCSFSPDGRQLAVLSSRLHLLDSVTGTILHSLEEANQVAYSSDARMLITSRMGEITIWDPRTFRKLRALSPQERPIKRFSLSPQGTVLAAASGSDISFWDVRTGQTLFVLAGPEDTVIYDLIFCPRETSLIAVGKRVAIDPKTGAGTNHGRIWQWSAQRSEKK